MKPPLNSMLKRSATGCVCVLAAVLGASACGTEAEAPLPPTGGQTSGGASGSAPIGTAGSALPQGGTNSPTAGASTTGGGGAGGGTATAGTSSGGSATAGSGGAPSGGSGGGSGGAGPDLKETVAGPLNGTMLLGPCLSDNNLTVCSTSNNGCPAKKPDDPATGGKLTTDRMLTLGGDASKTYTITLHVQGEVEAKGYDNGMDQDAANQKQHPTMDGFYIGGRPQTGDDYNVYMVRVSEPSKDYFLNSIKPPGITDHTTYLMDYTAKIQAKGGATIRLVAADTNCAMIKNCGPVPNGTAQCATELVKQNVDPVAVAKNPTFNFTQPYNGQWIVMVVTDVTEG
jgi:hypothetical protein